MKQTVKILYFQGFLCYLQSQFMLF